MKELPRVLLLGADELALGGIARLLDQEEGFTLVSHLEDHPDAILVDFEDGEPIENVRSLAPRYPVLALASRPDRPRRRSP